MQRLTVRSLVFLCGLLVAIGIERARGGVITPSSGNSPAVSSSERKQDGTTSPGAGGLRTEVRPNGTLRDSGRPPRGGESLSEALRQDGRASPDLNRMKPKPTPMLWTEDELVQAVETAARDGTSRSLERLNGRSLSSLPEYRERILPILKKECLMVLLRRFSQSDWTDWPRASFVLDGSPTPARTYVNDVFIVNEDLGRFLETAALLFHVSYLSAADGKIAQPEKALERVFAQADRFLVYRAPKAIPPRDMLDPEILDFPFVRDRMKQIQSGLVMRYIKDHPEEYSVAFDLLSQLPNDTIFPEVNATLADLLQRFSLEASPKFRQGILDRVLGGHLIAERSRQDARVARSLAHLFLMGVVDAIESKDLRRAHLYLDESYSFDPHLPAQDIVAESMRRAGEEAAEQAKAPSSKKEGAEAAKAPTKGEKSGDGEKEDESSLQLLGGPTSSRDQKQEPSFIERSVTILLYLLVLIVICGGAFLYVLYRRGLKAAGAVTFDDEEGRAVPGDLGPGSPADSPFGVERSPQAGGRGSYRAAASNG